MSTELTQVTVRAPLGDPERKARIRKALKDAKTTAAECARDLGLTEATVSRAIAGLQNTPRVEAWILDKTGLTRDQLFDVTQPAAV